ncbi:glycoside hydrolase family 38 C-terminal domain-containing protein [Tunturiibacter empetritectus]|uniref:Alpha-mannosidase n=2 Tax=Tunturiibacter TaxID=3154218 RepID=A0A852VSG0_9BACT|nr:glycoside hydrolase family 38 C-terminal domain-containing protein [Edaphobacter lichenicola]NYF92252.1 alpha-mannosidase [Edaphobacter lichenicola]
MTFLPRFAAGFSTAITLTLAAAFLAPACSSSAKAQSPEQLSRIIQSLSPESQTVIERLSNFDNLPAAEWRYHAGDVPHGEALDLDDTSWPVIKARSEAPNEAVWYRRVVEVPKTLNGYDLTDARIWFSFHANANGPMPQIIYFNGRRVALGDDIEPIFLFDHAKPGDKVLIAVKLLHTVDKKTFAGATLKIDFAPHRPNPEDLRIEFLTSSILIPTLSKNPTQDMATLQHAITTVDLSALNANDQSKFDASLTQATKELEQLKPMLQQVTFHLAGNSHIDAAWLWPWTETVDVVKRTFSTALQLMNEYPDYTYTQSAAQYNAWMADKYPQMNDEIKQRIKEGRWEVVGGMWVEPDLNMPDGESIVRSILIGKRWYQQHYGVDVRIGWNPDSFGYNWQLPQIYKRSGIDYFVTQKMAWNDANQLPFKLFWWESPDGSRVLTYFPHDYYNDNLNPLRLSADLAISRQRSPGMEDMMDLYGIGDHGGGPTRVILDEGQHWAQPDRVIPKMHFGLAQSFFTDAEQKVSTTSPEWNYESIAKGYTFPKLEEGKIVIPTWKDEMYLEYTRGVMTTQANHKRNMRESEEWALNSEKVASLAWLQGDPYPNNGFNEAWKKIVFNQFHDLAAGSGIGVIYKDAQEDYEQVRRATSEISTKALQTLSAEINTSVGGDVPILVFNSLAWQRDGLVMADVQLTAASANGVSVIDARDHVLPSTVLESNLKTNTYKLLIEARSVPSMGYEILHVIPGRKRFASDLKASGTTMENAALRVVIDPKTGCITSLFDKKSNFESLAKGACGNQLQTFTDTPKDFDAWNIDRGTLDRMTPIENVDSVKLIESDAVRAIVRVTRTWQSSKFLQDITLYANANTISVDNDIDWHETHILLKAAFPLAVTAPMATYEIPYGTIERPTTRNNSWEQAKFEVPAMRWADLGDTQHGFSLINESKYGYDGVNNLLRLSLLRSPTWPDPEADRGHHHFGYQLYPHAGTWQQALTERQGYEYNYKLWAVQVEAHTGTQLAEHSYLSVEPENVVLTAVKKAEDANGLIFRVVEWAGKQSNVTFTLPSGATTVTCTNLMEKPLGEPLPIKANEVTLPIRPYEILTIRADYPHPLEQAQTK